ncbi:MAG: hypothetical protein M0P22_06660 [Methanoculleus sp.]|jgi:hypothetical protein|nr:hypothetical protein [Methanoculleus sp.]
MGRASIRPVTSLFIALAVTAAAFLAVRWIGEGLIVYESYAGATLTPAGEEMTRDLRRWTPASSSTT